VWILKKASWTNSDLSEGLLYVHLFKFATLRGGGE
jgi:hypothetical protein